MRSIPIGRSSASARSTSLISDSTADRRALSGLLLMAAAVALLISTIGVYGVTAATTAARRRELAIRAAIGADRAGLIALGRAARPRSPPRIGVIAGIAGAIAASSILESVLFEVKARDPLDLRQRSGLACWRCADWRRIFRQDGQFRAARP